MLELISIVVFYSSQIHNFYFSLTRRVYEKVIDNFPIFFLKNYQTILKADASTLTLCMLGK